MPEGCGNLIFQYQAISPITRNDGDDPIAALLQAIPPSVLHDTCQVFGCFEDTRKDTLQDIETWTYDLASQSRVLWLTGSIRVGKSTIAMSLAFHLSDAGKLIGDFFFSKEHPGRSDAMAGIAAVIASRLSFFSADARKYLSRTIRSDPSILRAALDLQWQRLVLDTLAHVTERPSFRPLIIIDGLDACNSKPDQLWLINKLVNLCRSFPITVLITSRPEWHIKHEFTELQSQHPTLFRTTIELGDSDAARLDLRKMLLRSLYIREPLEQSTGQKRREMEDAINRYLESVDGQYSVIDFIGPYLGVPVGLGKGLQGIGMIPTNEYFDAAVYVGLDDVYEDFMNSTYSTLTENQARLCRRLLFHLIHIRYESIDGLSTFWESSPDECHIVLQPFYAVLRVPISNRQHITFYLSTFQKFLSSSLRGGAEGQFRLPWTRYCAEALERSLLVAANYNQSAFPSSMPMLWLTLCPRINMLLLTHIDPASERRILIALKRFDFSSWVQHWYLLQSEDLSIIYANFRAWVNQFSKILVMTKFRKTALSRQPPQLKKLVGRIFSFRT